MLKNSIKRWSALFLIAPLLSISCSEEFLETEFTGASTEDVYYSSVSGIGKLVVGTYAVMNTCAQGLHNIDVMYLGFGSFASDEAEAGGEQGGGDILDFQNWDQGNPQTIEEKAVSEMYWGYNYKMITRANQTLESIAKYRENNPSIPADSAALLDQYEGEMEFMRAFSQFRLTQVYGGVPIIDRILASSEYYEVRRATVAECLQFVQERMLVAIDLLPVQSEYSSADVGRVTRGAAEALLSKAYLYESSYAENYPSDERFAGCTNKYAEALTHLENIISSNEYYLEGIGGETFDTYWSQNGSPIYPDNTPGYRYIFTVDGENSRENIFSTQPINDAQTNYMLSRGSYVTIYTTVRNTSESTLGWGFNCPTEDLLNAYEDGDPRKMVTIGETGDPVYLNEAWLTIDCMQSPTNMIGRKYESSDDQYWSSRAQDSNGPNNLPSFRYGDIVLMAAEAAFKTNDAAKALGYVNMIRTRARNGASTGVPADLSAVTFDDIMNERLYELALEGHRFFDLVRWGETEVMVGQPLQKWLGGEPQESPVFCDFTVGVNEFFPIPEVEIINSNGALDQYPGYGQ